jgi:histidinol-phosphate aminotransferase
LAKQSVVRAIPEGDGPVSPERPGFPLEHVPPLLREMKPYDFPAPSRAHVRLDTNENPFRPPAEVMTDVAQVVRSASLNRYPDPNGSRLRELLGERHGVPPERITLGNGADELIGLLCSVFGHAPEGGRARIAFPWPSFVMYRSCAHVAGAEVVTVPLTPSFALDANAFIEAVVRAQPSVIFLARPNNPTGELWPAILVARVAAVCPRTLVISDEAYLEYVGERESGIDLIPQFPNIGVLRTLSKVGLAGLRVGYLIAQEPVIAQVNKARQPFNVGVINQAVASVVLERHWDKLVGSLQLVVRERKRLFAALKERRYLEVFPSDANFLLLRLTVPITGPVLARRLAEQGILVRHFGEAFPLTNCIRVAVGKPGDNKAFLAALDRAAGAGGGR